MRNYLLLIIVTLISPNGWTQSVIDWSEGYKLTLEDFQSPQTEINEDLNSSIIQTGCHIEFSYNMSNAEFMFTKNFNSKAKTVFNKNSSVITATDSITAESLVLYGQYNFDLNELYARKFRKELFDNKGAFSSSEFYKPLFDKLQEEMSLENARVAKESELGTNKEILKKEHDLVLKQIIELSDFCYSCKPPKKRKK